MHITLIVPAIEQYVLASDAPSKEVRIFRFSLLSVLTVAACTPPGHTIAIVDEHVEPLDLERPTDIVGVSFMTAHAPRAYAIGDEYLRRGVPVIFGGFHPTLMLEESLEHCSAVVRGEAEPVWPQLLRDVAAGTLKRVYSSVVPADLAQLTPPPRQLLNRADYFTVNAVEASRGCPYRCEYCSIVAVHSGPHRHRPVARVAAEIAALPGRGFMFIDDNLAGDRDYAMALFRAIAPLKKHWASQASVQIAQDPTLLRAAADAGCRGLFLGLESVNQDSLTGARKTFNRVDTYRDVVRRLHDEGICVEAGMVFGFDHDDTSTFERTLAAVNEIRVDLIQPSVLTPLPGTPLFERLEREGRILSRDWRLYDFDHAVFMPKRMSPTELEDGRNWLLHEFYSAHRTALRVVSGLLSHPAGTLLMGLPVNLGYCLHARRHVPRPRRHPKSATAY